MIKLINKKECILDFFPVFKNSRKHKLTNRDKNIPVITQKLMGSQEAMGESDSKRAQRNFGNGGYIYYFDLG